jgi:type IV secretion system protein TrbG
MKVAQTNPLTFSVALLLVIGCSTAAPVVRAPEAQFLRASPIVERDPAIAEPTGSEVPKDIDGEEPNAEDAFLSDPFTDRAEDPGPTSASAGIARGDAKPRPSTPEGVIAEANAMALQDPEAAGFLNAVMTYTFQPGGIYKVLAAPDSLTDLVLEPGEELMGDPAAGDTLRWRLGVGTSQVAGVPQKHVYLKPTRAGLTTTLALNTNRRTYFLRLESLERDSMVAVQWSYPQSQTLAPVAAATVGGEPAPAPTPPTADVAALNFDYEIEVTEGRPAWKPVAVYDDGAKTYIRFDPSMLHGESPALYVIERDEMQIVNYRVKGDLYIADRIFRLAELRLGQDEQDIVRLRNRRRGRTSSPPPRASSSPASPRRPATPR